MGYQDFGDGAADSRSREKLSALRLPENLSGKSVLDVGCNEGFFCGEAVKRGAAYVLGIDANESLIRKARRRVPEAQFETLSWWNIPDRKFDVILFLSAIHYEDNQRELLKLLHTRLADDGLLILECGVVRNDWDEKWHLIERHDGCLSFPSWGLLLNRLLDNFAVRDMGPSVEQKGDPLPRFVFHCTKLRPQVIFISGQSGAGKTVLSREFRKNGCRVINLDFEYGRMLSTNTTYQRDAALNYMRKIYEPRSLDSMLQTVVDDGKEDSVSRLIAKLVQPDVPLTLLEGYHLAIPSLNRSLRAVLEAKGFTVHEIEVDRKS